MNKYLYFTNKDHLSSIFESSLIDGKKSKTSNTRCTILNGKKPVIAFVYNVEKISKSKCYITYPMDRFKEPVLIFKKILGIPLIPKMVTGLKIPTELSAITFDVKYEHHLTDWFLIDKNLPEKMYCESVSTRPLIITDIEEVNVKEALKVIGLVPPYVHFLDFFYHKYGILISKDYLID